MFSPAYFSIGPIKSNMRKTKAVTIKPESKFHNETFTITGSGTLNLCEMATGDGAQDRSGRKIKLTQAQYMLRSSTANTAIRAILYVPKDQSDDLILANNYDPVDNALFWVLDDKFWDPNGSATVGSYVHRFPNGLFTEYGDNTDTAAAIKKGGVKLFLSATGTGSDIVGHTKVWYYDN